MTEVSAWRTARTSQLPMPAPSLGLEGDDLARRADEQLVEAVDVEVGLLDGDAVERRLARSAASSAAMRCSSVARRMCER